MALLSLFELIDIVLMSACIGYIFAGHFGRYNTFKKPNHYDVIGVRRFNWSDFAFSIAVVGPAIFLHELGHKFVAMSFGYDATFFSAISINKVVNGMPFFDFATILMIIALVSTYIGASFFFFVPAYVAFSSLATPFQQMLIAFAGPLVNLILWRGSIMLVKQRKVSHKYIPVTILTSNINKLLFIFNMIPFPGFDGFYVLTGLFSSIFG